MSNLIFAQNFKGIIYDNNTKKAIYGVKITDITENTHYISGYNGSFTIPFNNKRKIVIEIEHIGYEKQTLSYNLANTVNEIYLVPKTNNITEVVINGTLSPYYRGEWFPDNSIPQISGQFATTTFSVDEYLKYSSEINIIKPTGIFENSPIITINGMSNNPGRTLVLFDDIKLNKSDDGNVNWNMLPPSVVSSISLENTPLSSMYGNNAMGGVIYLHSLYPQKGFHGFIKAHQGQYNTLGSEIGLSHRHKDLTGFFFSLNAFAQKSDGYISTPDTLQSPDIEYIPTFLKEIKANFVAGYNFRRNNTLKITTNYFDDFRNLGEKIQETKGAYTKHSSQFASIKYKGSTNRFGYLAIFSAQNEKYFKNIETLKKEQYSLIFVNSLRRDFSGNLSSSYNFNQYYNLHVGIHSNYGEVKGIDSYQTSPDIIKNSGQLIQTNAYLKNNFIYNGNYGIFFSLGGNYSYSLVKSPSFLIENPTSATDFMLPYTAQNEDNNFTDYSLNSDFIYDYKSLKIYASASTGYNTPTLEDLTRSGFNRYGFKIANPELLSEKMTAFKFGFNIKSKINFDVNGIYKTGNNFMYYIETGDELFGGSKKIIQKQNVTNVLIYGVNTNINYKKNWLKLFASYTFNYSSINKFNLIPELEGKTLTYSPLHSAHAGVMFEINKLKLSAVGNYSSNQFTNNINTEFIDAYYTIDIKANAEIIKSVFFEFSVQNFLDYQYLNYYNQLSIGRFMLFSLQYKW